MAGLLEQLLSLAMAGTVMISSSLTAAAPQNDINGLLYLQTVSYTHLTRSPSNSKS